MSAYAQRPTAAELVAAVARRLDIPCVLGGAGSTGPGAPSSAVGLGYVDVGDLPALYANDDTLASDWLDAGAREYDPLWRMPLWRPYLRYLTSTVADIANGSSSTMAGSVTAALYLERFVPEGQTWGHVDVYSWNDSDRPGRPAGGEAQGLRAAFAMLKRRYG